MEGGERLILTARARTFPSKCDGGGPTLTDGDSITIECLMVLSKDCIASPHKL